MGKVKRREEIKKRLQKLSVAKTLSQNDNDFLYQLLEDNGVAVRTIGCELVILENGLTRTVQTTAQAVLKVIKRGEKNHMFIEVNVGENNEIQKE